MDRVKTRQSKYELIRIIAAILITLNHIPCSKSAPAVNLMIKKFFFLGGQFGVNLFVILGIWFLAKNAEIKIERIMRIIGQMIFYSLFLDMVMLILGYHFSMFTFFRSFVYWFPFGYIFMLIMAPRLIKISNYTKILAGCLGGGISCIVTLIGTVTPGANVIWIFSKGLFIGPIWFCYLFLLLSWIIGEGMLDKIGIKWSILLWMSLYFVMYFVEIKTNTIAVRNVYSPICFLSAIFLFNAIRQCHIHQNIWINRIASLTFGTYLLQTHQIVEKYIWDKLFRLTYISEKSFLYIIAAFIAVLIIFLLTIVVQTIYRKIQRTGCMEDLERLISGAINEVVFRIERKLR